MCISSSMRIFHIYSFRMSTSITVTVSVQMSVPEQVKTTTNIRWKVNVNVYRYNIDNSSCSFIEYIINQSDNILTKAVPRDNILVFNKLLENFALGGWIFSLQICISISSAGVINKWKLNSCVRHWFDIFIVLDISAS